MTCQVSKETQIHVFRCKAYEAITENIEGKESKNKLINICKNSN